MKTITTLIAGALAGIALSMSTGATAQQAPKQHDVEGNGYYVDCTDNGKGGYRRCDLHVEAPSDTHRVDLNLYKNKTFEIGIVSWGYNGGKDKSTPTMVDSPLQTRVVR